VREPMRKFTVAALCTLSMLAGPGAALSAETNAERWLVLTNPGKPTMVVATGALNARGTVTDVFILNPDGTFDNLATQAFPDGNLFYHGQGTFDLTVDARTCHGEGEVFGPFEITGGTGAYAGATGAGVAIIDLSFWFDKTGAGCSLLPARVHAVAHATGVLDLP
jgi:hypothetical protein